MCVSEMIVSISGATVHSLHNAGFVTSINLHSLLACISLCYTLIAKKFQTPLFSDKKVSENKTIRNF